MQKLIGICLCFISLSFFPYIKASASDYHLFFDKENTHLDSGYISLTKKWQDGRSLSESIDLNYIGIRELGNIEIENMHILRYDDNTLSILIIPRREHRYTTVAWEIPYEFSGRVLSQVEILNYYQSAQRQDYINLSGPGVNDNRWVEARIVHNYSDPLDRGYPRRQRPTCSTPSQQTQCFSY